ncbi:phosducin-like protein [Sabethes cyaneus]|uniref:phosducin-like protein n=1 Tax=Sabethes cyaneus TaxID=53552 RepID=UPI00221E2FF6|nr:phosducin-like protein [Sabethes cyaneus]
MATLEDKILGEKNHYYCSSSEDEADDDCVPADGGASGRNKPDLQFIPESSLKDQTYFSACTSNTGPKGVINDWQRFKQLEAEKREHQDKEKLELIKKLSITVQTNSESENVNCQKQLDDLVDLENDKFLLEYQRKRMSEMLAMAEKLPKFGVLIDIQSGEDFLKAVDDEQKSVTVVIHIYDSNNNACKNMNDALVDLATEYTNVKFCKFMSSIAGLSRMFKVSGLPAILVYKAGQIIGNFVRLTDDLSDDFNSSDVESFLIEVGMLPDKYSVPLVQ